MKNDVEAMALTASIRDLVRQTQGLLTEIDDVVKDLRELHHETTGAETKGTKDES